MQVLRVLLGDQLSRDISSLSDCDPDHDTVLMCEVRNEASYVRHHKKKIAFIFSAMRHFAAELRERGFNVDYVTLDHPDNTGSLAGEVRRAVGRDHPHKLVATIPGEYRILNEMQNWQRDLRIDVEIRPDGRFLCSPEEFKVWAANRKQLRMEFFYREMRRKYGILMHEEGPEGGRWNFDSENRKPLDAGATPPHPYSARADPLTSEVLDLVDAEFGDHFGDLEPFYLAVTRDQALRALDKFISERLPFLVTSRMRCWRASRGCTIPT